MNISELPIIYFHGSPGLPEEFAELAKFFPKNQITSFARKGYPNSEDFQEVPASKDIIVLGYSWGNVPALKYIIKNIKHVKGFIMVSPYLYSKNNSLITGLVTLPILSDIIFPILGKRIINSMLKKTSFPLSVPSSYQDLVKKLAAPSILKAAILEKNKAVSIGNMFKEIRNSKIPVAIIWGSKDLTSREDKQITPIYGFIKPILEERLQNVGHAIIFTNPRKLAEFIKNFRNKIGKEKNNYENRIFSR